LGIKDRGLLQVGNFADVVIFDPDEVTDRATPISGRDSLRSVKRRSGD